ncbi:MAG: hypothetical protein D6785_07375 [Planctomycetota bacterium]|nr:MAG: hypothetical protein D6785_07375 [Planctomycetota bacterium]
MLAPFKKSHLILIAFFLVFVGLLGMDSFLLGQGASSIEIRRKFREVIRLLEEGHEAEAGRKFDEVLSELSQHPDKELILELRDEAGYQWFLKAMTAKPRQGDSEEDKVAIKRLVLVAQKFLKLASIEEKRKKTNVKRVKDLLNKMATSRHEERYYWMEVIGSKVGQYVFLDEEIPAILGNSDDKRHIPIIILLTRLGEHAVLPLIELLDSNDSVVRRNAAAILGNIKDRRALPALIRLAQNDGDGGVKAAASKAVEKMMGKINLKDAKEYYLALAEKYYENDPYYTRNSYQESVIWKWEKGKLHHWEVPRILFNESLAEEALFDALDLDSDYDAAWTLLLNVYFAELNEVNSSLEVARNLADKGKLNEKGRVKLPILVNASRALRMVKVVTSLRGKVQLYRALKRAMDDKRVEVAVSCIEALRDLKVDGSLLPRKAVIRRPVTVSDGKVRKVKGGNNTTSPAFSSPPKSEGQPLVDALSYDDKRVRYAAAEALARLNPKEDFYGSEKVVEVLAQAVSEIAPRTVLIIANSPQVRNTFKDLLIKLNYEPFTAPTGKSGIFRALSVPTWDLIMISDYLPDLRAYEIINKLKNDYRTKHIPIFVLAKAKLRRRTEIQYQGRAEKVISMKATQVYLQSVLNDLFGTEEYKNDIKGRTVLVAKKAAEALASIPVRDTILQPQNAISALVKILPKQPPEVKLPIMKAMANLKDPQALPVLLATFDRNNNNPEEVRIGACFAIGEILKSMAEITQETYLALKGALQESSYKINLAAARAFGKVPLDPQRYRELFNLRSENDGPYLFRHIFKIRGRR